MKTIIAEKPSVAREIAKIVGATKKDNGYMTGNGYFVTWAFGHLVEIYSDEAEGKWEADKLPIIPSSFSLRSAKNGDRSIKQQLDIIGSLFDKSDEIIVATDAGREGELIFRYIYNYLNCRKRFRRLWISSLTDKAIREGLQALRPGEEYDALYRSAKARSEADWLVGINATEALTLSAGQGLMSLGRVQTPTLAMICSRYLENKNFKPEKFWTLSIPTTFHRTELTVKGTKRYTTLHEAETDREKAIRARILKVEKVERKEKRTPPPLLYDLTNLQKDANKRYGMTADSVLSAAQSLYEKKLITYPRTGSQYISRDVLDTLPEIFDTLASHPLYGSFVSVLKRQKPNERSVNDDKVTDHHAILVTENKPSDTLSGNEEKVYDMIVIRNIESFLNTCIEETTKVTMTAEEVEFVATGSVPIFLGWKEVRRKEEKEKEKENDDDNEEKADEKELPPLKENDILPIRKVNVNEGQTKPKPIHTEASLLAAMETAGKEAEDDTIREALKDIGLGTPATRATIIETLIKRLYVERQSRKLIPTTRGLAVYDLVKDKAISNAEMTGTWEKSLNHIAEGKEDVAMFNEGIRTLTRQMVAELLDDRTSKAIQKNMNSSAPDCPKCRKKMEQFRLGFKCGECDIVLWRNVCKKSLKDEDIIALSKMETTRKISGFISRNNKRFSARLKLNKDYKVEFIFEDDKK